MMTIDPANHERIVFFTGAGMSAESGVPTYRGHGGVWKEYNWEEYACQDAFDRDPEKVMAFHELRRQSILSCPPHEGHRVIARLERNHPSITVITQNIDGMHQRAGNKNVLELHGSIWRLRCALHGSYEDTGEHYERLRCLQCDSRLRPDIVWFGDALDPDVIRRSVDAIALCDLFISIGTSGMVWPAAGYPEIARRNGARCIEINPEPNQMSHLYDDAMRLPAGDALPSLFSER